MKKLDSYKNFYGFISGIGLNKFQKVSYNYAKGLPQKTELIQFYKAVTAETYLGSSVAQNQFNQFLENHPESKYKSYVQHYLDR